MRLSREQVRELSPADAHLWLRDRGLKQEGDSWLCGGEELRHFLRDDEILETITTVSEGGVTFINTVRGAESTG